MVVQLRHRAWDFWDFKSTLHKQFVLYCLKSIFSSIRITWLAERGLLFGGEPRKDSPNNQLEVVPIDESQRFLHRFWITVKLCFHMTEVNSSIRPAPTVHLMAYPPLPVMFNTVPGKLKQRTFLSFKGVHNRCACFLVFYGITNDCFHGSSCFAIPLPHF